MLRGLGHRKPWSGEAVGISTAQGAEGKRNLWGFMAAISDDGDGSVAAAGCLH
jgi:hypothetical protein